MDYNAENQHKMFGTWLRVTELKLDRDALSARWTTVYRILVEIDFEKSIFLIDYLFDLPYSDAKLQWFQEEFHNDDPMFIMQKSDNKRELKNLVSVLVLLLLENIDPDNEEFNPVIANYTLAVSCAGLRDAGTQNQAIVDSAKALVREYAISARERGNFSTSESNTWEQAKIDKAIESIDDADSSTIQGALKIISNVARNTITTVKRNNLKLSSNIKHLVKIQDEELNILWWLINANSSFCNCLFDDLDNKEKPLILGLELAKLTALAVEIPSAQVIFQKAGVDINTVSTFSEFIDGISKKDELIENLPDCNETYTPVLYALKNKTLNDCWFEECRSKIHINNDTKISSLEWALQVYRETMVCNSMKEYI